MKDHVRILAILNIVMGSIGLLIGLGLLFMFGGIGMLAGIANSGDPDAALALPVMGAIGGIIFVALLIFSAPQIIGGIGLLKGQPWARIRLSARPAQHPDRHGPGHLWPLGAAQ